jgi:hypothetical protein
MALSLHEVLTDLHRDHPGVVIIAYVDDIVILAPPELVRLAYLDLVEMLWTRLGLVSQPRKCDVYSSEGDVSTFPASMAGADGSRQGVVVLGVPIGSDEFVLQTVGRRMRDLGRVVPLLSILRDPQMKYLLLRCYAHPRVSHLLRGVPPDLARPGAVQYDATILEGLQDLLPGAPLSEKALRVVELPIRMGGLGLTSAVRVSLAAYLGSWAQVMAPMAASSFHLQGIVNMAERLPSRSTLSTRPTRTMSAPRLLSFGRERSRVPAYPYTFPRRNPSSPPNSSQQLQTLTPKTKAYAAVLLSREWCNIADGIEDEAGRTWFMSLTHNSLGGQFLMAVPKSAVFHSRRQSSRRRSASACGKLNRWLCL